MSATYADVTVEATVATGEVELGHHASTRSAFCTRLGGFAVAGRGIIASDAGGAWAPAEPCPDDTRMRALARAHRWKRMLDDGKYRSAVDIAEPEGVTRSFVYGLIRLTFLAPDIVEAILEGMPPNGYGAGGVDTAKSKMLENIPTGSHMLFVT